MGERLSVSGLLDGHVTLEVECFDRLYLNGYVQNLQTAGGTVFFLHDHRGYPIPSPALFQPMGEAFRKAVHAFAEQGGIPLVRFKPRERKLDVVRPYLDRAAADGREGVVALGLAQERQWVWMGTDVQRNAKGIPQYSFRKVERRISVFYFYFHDAQWGAGFLKIASYFPYPIKLWCNGHEWAKRQLDARGIAYTALANGFASCADPRALQQICDRLGDQQVGALFRRWLARLPLPLSAEDRLAGYDWELSMNQVEFSRTLVLDRPARVRAFFERVVSENLGLGRPTDVALLFDRRLQRNTKGLFHTTLIDRGTEPHLSFHWKSSRIKEYLKEGRAIRIETTINNPLDIAIKRRIAHLGELRIAARTMNHRILELQRVASTPDLATSLFEQVALPYVRDGRRTVALRYGDPRVMALLAALAHSLHQLRPFSNAELRTSVAQLLGRPYRSSQMSYDLRRLRDNGLVRRLERTNRYLTTEDGTRVAIFFTKTYERIVRPLLAVDTPDAPPRALPELRQALRTIDRLVQKCVQEAGIAA